MILKELRVRIWIPHIIKFDKVYANKCFLFAVFPYCPARLCWTGSVWSTKNGSTGKNCTAWWRHQMETFSALLAICAGNSPVPGEFPAQRPVTRSFGAFFDLRLNKRLRQQSWGWWFEKLSHPLWRHCNCLQFPNIHEMLCHVICVCCVLLWLITGRF